MNRLTDHLNFQSLALLALPAASLLAWPAPAQAQCLNSTLTPWAPHESGAFGFAGAIDGDRIIMGSPYDEATAALNSGTADVFRRQGGGWIFDGHLIAPQPFSYALFGKAADIDGNLAIVGEPNRNLNAIAGVGQAHVYYRDANGWHFAVTLAPSTSPPNIESSYFAQALSLDGSYALIGMPDGPSGPTSKAGVVYLYQNTFGYNGWSLIDTLPAPSPTNDNLDFGDVVAMMHGPTTGTTHAVVGVPNYSPSLPLTDSGQIRVYPKPASGADWGSGIALSASDQQADARFGSAVAVSGLSIAVGAPGYDLGAQANAGAVYIFTRTGGIWLQTAQIDNPVPGLTSFGTTVALDGDTLLIGRPGRVYSFRNIAGDWHHEWTFPGVTTDFGSQAVGLSGDTLVVGNPYETGISPGQAKVYELQESNAANFCALATEIPTGTHWGCTAAATRDGRSSCDLQVGGTDVWYRWQAPCHGTATINTDLSDFDTLLSVHSACPDLVSNTVVCQSHPSSNYATVSFDVQQNEWFLIRIAGAAHQVSGNYILNIEMECAPPCDADIAPQPDGDGAVNVSDLLLVINTWGVIHGAGDVNHDAQVNVNDLLAVINNWGSCPPVGG